MPNAGRYLSDVAEPDPTPQPLDRLTFRGRRDDIAIEAKGCTLTYAELETHVGALAGWLRDQALAPGNRVASWLPKSLAALLLPLAAPRAGLVHVPINPVLKRAQAAHILADSGARLLITARGRAESLIDGDRPGDCALLLEDIIDWANQGLPPSEADPATLAALLYTSGSTGRPKGVMLSHANLWLGAVSVAHFLGLKPDDRVLAVLPLAFDYGQNQLLSTWYAGGAVIPLDYLAPADVVRAVARYRPTTLAGVPPLWTSLVEARWPAAASLARLTNSGGALTRPLIARMRSIWPDARIHAMYGLTEAFRSTALDPALIDAHPDAMGTAIPFAQVSVRRPDGTIADPDEPGELVHTGPLVAGGYWRDAERTAARFRTEPGGGVAVWSGDMVTKGADGLFRFVGREDEMIKTAGNRLSPNEIEAAAVASGTTAEAVAIGVPDERLGQAVILVVAGAPDDHLAAHLHAELPSYMQPRTILWRDALPRNANGKLDRAALRAELAA